LPRRILRLAAIPTLPTGKRDGRAIEDLLAVDD
jgi:hypothetical protein